MTPSELSLRQAAPADAALLRAITRAAYARWVPVIGREPLPMQADYRQALIHHRIDLIEGEGEAVGLIETRIEPDHLWIENLAVLPAWQGQGLGRHLLDHAQELARQAGLPRLQLLTNAAFEDNIAFYRRRGFTVTRTEPFLNGLTVYMEWEPAPCA